MLDHVIDEQRFGKAQQIAKLCRDHLFDIRFVDDRLQRAGEILDDHNGLGAGVLKLVFEFARRVKRIAVHHHASGAQDAKHHYRVLEDVGHHDRHAIALGQLGDTLQIARKCQRLTVKLIVAHGFAHA